MKRLCLILPVLLAACSPTSLLNGITSVPGSVAKNISYGEADVQAYDLYRPETPKPDAPILVFVHGGGWNSGDKDMYKFVGARFAQDGYTTAIPGYRLWPEARYPDFIEDSAAAVANVAETFPDRPLVLIGHSAGAYNVLKLVQDPSFLQGSGIESCARVAGVVSLAAPTGAYPMTDEPYITIFPDRFGGDDAVLGNLSTPLPPVLFVHGSEDTTVGPKNSTDLAEAITARGGVARVEIYKGLDHIDVVKGLSKYFDEDAPVLDDIFAFIDGLNTSAESHCMSAPA